MRAGMVGAAAGTLCLLAACAQQPAPPAAVPAPRHTLEKLLFESDHIRYVEVTNLPGDNLYDAVPYPSIVMVDAAMPEFMETPLDPAAAAGESRSEPVYPRENIRYPWCRTQSPTAARTVTVKGNFPQHYYRLDYKRVDGKDYGIHALQNFATAFGPPAKTAPDLGMSLKGGKPWSADWPFDFRYNAADAAPANHTIHYRDDHIEVIEVAIRDQEVENMHGHPYRSVYADDGGMHPTGAIYKNTSMAPERGQPWGAVSKAPAGAEFPVCMPAVPEEPHAVRVVKGPPQHFYRVHFIRVEGDAAAAAQP